MNYRSNYFALILCFVISLSISCSDDTHTDPEGTDCFFVQNDDDNDGLIDETETAIMEDCQNNRIPDQNEIKTNLIGEWNIIGYGDGWPSSNSQPCGKVIFTALGFSFRFENGTQDIETSGTWDIIETENNNLLLEVSEPYSYLLGFSMFCEAYMFFDHTDSDGDMYIYEKVK